MTALILAAILCQPAPDATPRSEATISVRPTDIDGKGHVNNARYLEYLQVGRWGWLGDRGISDDSLRAAGCVLVVARVEIDYRAEVRHGDSPTVSSAAHREGEKKVVFIQEIRRRDGVVAATARTVMVAIDAATRRSIPVPPALAAHLPPPTDGPK